MKSSRMGRLFGMVSSARSDLYTHYAIRSFFKHTKLYAHDQFILIDNDNIWPDHPSALIKLIKNSSPKSFSHNVNQLIDIARSFDQDLYFLSNDIIFTNNWDEPLHGNDDTILIPSCNQTHTYHYNNFDLPANLDLEDFGNNFDALDQIVFQHKQRSNPDFFEKLLMPFYVFKLPKNAYNTVGYFDEAFINGGEDIDYRVRALLNDIQVKYVFQSYLLHFNGKSTWRSAEDIAKTEERNRIYKNMFENKWGSDLKSLLFLGEDPNSVLRKYDLMSFDERIHSYNNLIRVIWKLSNQIK